jgi:hypothetical protein
VPVFGGGGLAGVCVGGVGGATKLQKTSHTDLNKAKRLQYVY